MIYFNVTVSTEQSPSLEADSRSAGNEILLMFVTMDRSSTSVQSQHHIAFLEHLLLYDTTIYV
jgi:hypothetical protein